MSDVFDQFQGTASYIASDELRHAVNVAVALARPLLVRGEPGTGKTLLAENLASALHLPLIRWHVKSTTKARDGLYVYDTVARLHDSRFGDGANVRDIARHDSRIVSTLSMQTKKPWAIDTKYFTPCPRPVYLTNMAVAPDVQHFQSALTVSAKIR